MILGFGNNIRSALAADINSTQTVIAVMPGTGALFAKTLQAEASLVNPSYTSTLYSKLTLTDELETVFEICHLVSVSGDNLTVIRGQELTKAKGWSLNDVVSNFPTRGSENNFIQIEDLQSGKYLSAKAGGTGDALTVSIPSTFYVNGGNTFALRAPLLITPTLANSGPATVQLTVSGRVVGTYPILKGVSSPLEAGDITVSVPVMLAFSPELSCFFMTNPGKGLVDSGAFLLKANNLSDLPNTNTARTNLGLGSMATQNTNAVSITGGTATLSSLSSGSVTVSGQISTGTLSATGKISGSSTITPGDYGNFDARYLKASDLPVGVPFPWPSTTIPNGFLKCVGQTFSTGTYPQLALAYPSGVLPDMRDQFIRGCADGRALLSYQAGQSPASTTNYNNYSNPSLFRDTGYTFITGTDNDGVFRAFQELESIRETRPKNIAFNFIVRAA